MEEAFRKILELSITGGGIILIIIFIRIFLREVPGIFSYILWVIPAIRLLMPVTFTGIWGLVPICTNLVRMLAFVTCPFFVFQQKNPQNTQERHPQKEG